MSAQPKLGEKMAAIVRRLKQAGLKAHFDHGASYIEVGDRYRAGPLVHVITWRRAPGVWAIIAHAVRPRTQVSIDFVPVESGDETTSELSLLGEVRRSLVLLC